MAEYYPLLSRAVAGLRDGAPEAREAIYARARQALVGQLRGMQPPVPDDAVNKEITALDEAIAKIEAEIKPPRSVSDAASAAVEAALLLDGPAQFAGGTLPPGEAVQPSPRGDAGPAPIAVRPPANRPAAPTAARVTTPSASRPDRPTFTPRSSLPGARGGPRPDPAVPTSPVGETPSEPAPSAPLQGAALSPLPAAPTLDGVSAKRDMEGGAAAPEPAVLPVDISPFDVKAESPGPGLRVRDEGARPAMPRPPNAAPRNLRVWIVAVVALAAVVAIAFTAWKLRDNPEQLAHVAAQAPQADSAPGKIVQRADGAQPADDDGSDAGQPGTVPFPATSTPAPQAATPVPAPSAGTTAQPASDQTVPVSYKAAVLVAAPETPEKVRTFVGSVVWRSEGSTQDPATLTVRADVDVAEAKLQMTMEIRKNTEAQFPASNTIDIKFTPGPGSLVGNVKQLDVPQMRREDAPTGDPLSGVPVTITANSFLVGLSRGDAEAHNVDAMRNRGWFDIPMVLEDGKPAKITFEKGASGDRILADALTAWSRN